MNVKDYLEKNEILFSEWETESREWMVKNGFESRATFYKDGVICPTKWFDINKRILFILKEVHETSLRIDSLCVDFIHTDDGTGNRNLSCEDYDIWDGEATWRKVGSLARGILSIDNNGRYTPYHLFQKNDDDMKKYHEILNQIAIINLKKYPGGSDTGSYDSMKTGAFTLHAERFAFKLAQQIKLINPNIIICCGKNTVINYIKPLINDMEDIRMVDAYHPTAYVSIEKYYDEIIHKLL